MGTWASLVPRGFGTCCLGGQKSPPGRPALPLSMRVMPSYLCYPWDRRPEEGTAPIARPLPPRQTTGLGPGDRPSAERELEPGSNSWPHSSIPGGHRLVPRPPSQPRSQAAPHPPKHTARDVVGRGCEGTTGWEISYSLATRMQDLTIRLWGGPAWPPPHGAPASFHCLCSWARSPCRNTCTSDDWKTPGGPHQPEGTMGVQRDSPPPSFQSDAHRSVQVQKDSVLVAAILLVARMG